MNALKAWFSGLAHRERLILIGGAAAALLIVLWAFVLRPLSSGAAELRDSVADKEQLLLDVQRASTVAPAAAASSGAAAGQSLVVLVDSTAKTHGLALPRTRPDGENGINVAFQAVSFDALLAWLIELETTYAVRVESASFSSGRQQGLVNGQLFLRRS